MPDFVLIPQYDYVAELLRLVPSFAESNEFLSLDSEDRIISGLVFASFARYMEAVLVNATAMDECSKAIESFVSRGDLEATNLIVTEVYEGFRRPAETVHFLLQESRALYEKWISECG